jgi:hypothetical protein
MDKRDAVGQFVILKEDFLDIAHKFIVGSEIIKYTRPYLVIELSNEEKNKTRLFAIPTQTSVADSMDSSFFEKLPRRIETRLGCDRGLLFGEMLPITAEHILSKKEADKQISYDETTQQIIIQNLMFRKEDSIPEKARPSFRYLQKQALHYGMSAIGDKQFKQSFRIVAEAIHNETIKIKNEKFEKIVGKAQNYLENHYIKFLRAEVYKNADNTEKVKMPIRFTQINRLLKFLKENDTQNVKTSLQQESVGAEFLRKKYSGIKLSADEMDIVNKYKIMPEKYSQCKKMAEDLGAEQGKKYSVEGLIRFCILDKPEQYDKAVVNTIRAEEHAKGQAKQQKKTQEKIITKSPKKEQKPDNKKPKKSGDKGK